VAAVTQLPHTALNHVPRWSGVIAGMWRMAEWGMDTNQRLRFIQECVDLGVTTFDHADIYGGGAVETLFGEALASSSALKQKIQVISKCGIQPALTVNGTVRLKHYNHTQQHITASVNTSLRKLGLEKLDLLLIHRPSALMDFNEMAHTFQQLHAAGKVLHFGVSNFTPVQFAALQKRYPLVTNQVQFSPLYLNPMDDGVFDQLQDMGARPMVWSALARGKVFTGTTPQDKQIQKTITLLAQELGLTPASVVYAWIMRLPCKPIPLTGSGRIAAIGEARAALTAPMTEVQWFTLLQAARGADVP
jgi:predicted oxidoreductase